MRMGFGVYCIRSKELVSVNNQISTLQSFRFTLPSLYPETLINLHTARGKDDASSNNSTAGALT